MSNELYTEGQEFKNEALTLPRGEYENCTFVACSFVGSDFSKMLFVNCHFADCDFSMLPVKGASFREVSFVRCKMLGLRFDTCNPFLLEMSFEGCQLNFTSFYKLKLKNTRFVACQLEEADFSEADLTSATFEGSNLKRAVFDGTNLEQADFRAALGFSIDPTINRVQKAKFSSDNLVGLLDRFGILIS